MVGDIPNVQGTHGAQIVPELGRGFSSNGRANSVTIFDLKTLAVINEVKLPAADGPDGFMYDPATMTKAGFTYLSVGRPGLAQPVDPVAAFFIPRSRDGSKV